MVKAKQELENEECDLREFQINRVFKQMAENASGMLNEELIAELMQREVEKP